MSQHPADPYRPTQEPSAVLLRMGLGLALGAGLLVGVLEDLGSGFATFLVVLLVVIGVGFVGLALASLFSALAAPFRRRTRPPPLHPESYGDNTPARRTPRWKAKVASAPKRPARTAAEIAERATGTLEPLTRTPLTPGTPVLVCRGRQGLCEAVIPSELRPDLRDNYEDRCPVCSTVGTYEESFIPLSAEATDAARVPPLAGGLPAAPPPFEGPRPPALPAAPQAYAEGRDEAGALEWADGYPDPLARDQPR